MEIKQGDIILLELDPTKGHEQRGFRPCVCLSNDLIFKFSNVIVIAPISNTKRKNPMYYPLAGYEISGKILLDQIRTIDPKARKARVLEKLEIDDLDKVLNRVKLVFDKNI
jgi:mRNA interferase MazF